MGIEPTTFTTPVWCSTSWAAKPLGGVRYLQGFIQKDLEGEASPPDGWASTPKVKALLDVPFPSKSTNSFPSHAGIEFSGWSPGSLNLLPRVISASTTLRYGCKWPMAYFNSHVEWQLSFNALIWISTSHVIVHRRPHLPDDASVVSACA